MDETHSLPVPSSDPMLIPLLQQSRLATEAVLRQHDAQAKLMQSVEEGQRSLLQALQEQVDALEGAATTPPSTDDSHTSLLAHLRSRGSRPTLEALWGGGKNVRQFLQEFEIDVEKIPGISKGDVWRELNARTKGLAKKMLLPLMDLSPGEAIRSAKKRYLDTWARNKRLTCEMMSEICSGKNVKSHDFDSLVDFKIELEDCKRKAILHGDSQELDKPEHLMMIVLARMGCFEEKWRKIAHRSRLQGLIVNFDLLLKFIDEETVISEEPEGVPSASRLKEYTTHILARSTGIKKGVGGTTGLGNNAPGKPAPLSFFGTDTGNGGSGRSPCVSCAGSHAFF